MIRLLLASALMLFASLPGLFAEASEKTLILATTTSTRDSGLLDAILPAFTAKTGIQVKVIAVGSGAALKMGIDGDADVVLSHDPAGEKAFVAGANAGTNAALMHNDFVLVGPTNSALPAAAKQDAKSAFAWMLSNAVFVSRGDQSGTHKKELGIWKTLGATNFGANYLSVGRGMGEVLLMAGEKQAYTLADRATWLSMKSKLPALSVVCEADKSLLNPYRVMTVNPAKNNKINQKAASLFFHWIQSPETRQLISGYGVKEYGEALFTLDAPDSIR